MDQRKARNSAYVEVVGHYDPRRQPAVITLKAERIQYWLGYTSTNRNMDGRWRQISVKVKNRPNAAVRTRKGYYARSDQSGSVKRAGA